MNLRTAVQTTAETRKRREKQGEDLQPCVFPFTMREIERQLHFVQMPETNQREIVTASSSHRKLSYLSISAVGFTAALR